MNSSDSDICAGPRKSREAQKHFGAAGRPGSHVKPFTRSRFEFGSFLFVSLKWCLEAI